MSNETIIKLAAVVGVIVAAVSLVLHGSPPPVRPGQPDPDRTINELTRSLQEDPNNFTRWRQLGRQMARQENPSKAVKKWIANVPEDLQRLTCPEAYIWYWTGWGGDHLGATDVANQGWSRAIPRFKAFMNERPGQVTFVHWYRLGLSYLQLEQQADAAEAMTMADQAMAEEISTRHRPELAPYLRGMINAWQRMDRQDRVAMLYIQYIDLNERIVDTWGQQQAVINNWSFVANELRQLLLTDETHDAVREGLDRIRVHAQSAEQWHAVGWIAHDLGDTIGAYEAWRETLRLQVAYMESVSETATSGDWYNLACYRALVGEHDAALEALDRAVDEGWHDIGMTRDDEDLVSIRGEAMEQILERVGPRG